MKVKILKSCMSGGKDSKVLEAGMVYNVPEDVSESGAKELIQIKKAVEYKESATDQATVHNKR